MKSNITGLTYAQSGVDIDAGNKLIDNIKPAASKTSRAGVISGLGGLLPTYKLIKHTKLIAIANKEAIVLP